ncbi:hypothetical protein ABZ611_33480 [Streptomyces sp. NPDC007861]
MKSADPGVPTREAGIWSVSPRADPGVEIAVVNIVIGFRSVL